MAMAKMASEEYAVAKERLDKKSQSVSKTAAALGRQKLAAAEAKAVTKTRLVTKVANRLFPLCIGALMLLMGRQERQPASITQSSNHPKVPSIVVGAIGGGG